MSFCLTNQSLKTLGQIEGSMCLVKDLQHPCITLTVKHGGGFVMVWGTFSNCEVLHQEKGKLNQTSYQSTMQHHTFLSGMQLLGQGFYSCKIMIQSILINSARGALKAKRNSMSFN